MEKLPPNNMTVLSKAKFSVFLTISLGVLTVVNSDFLYIMSNVSTTNEILLFERDNESGLISHIS